MKRLLLSVVCIAMLSSIAFSFVRNVGLGLDIRKTYIGENYSDYKINLNADTKYGYGYVMFEKELGKLYTGYNVNILPFRDRGDLLIDLDSFYNEGRKMNTTSFRVGFPLILSAIWIGGSFNIINEVDTKPLLFLKADVLDLVKLVCETDGTGRTILDIKLEKDFPLTDKLYFSPVTKLRQINSEYFWQINGNIKFIFSK